VQPWALLAQIWAENAGTENGIISENTLTGARKMMNMQKLGTLVQSNQRGKNG
jgi:hypothetical protein